MKYFSPKFLFIFSIIFILLISFLNVFPAYPADSDSPEKVTDLSDRKYEQVLIDLLDNAKESIVVSMYGISPGAGEKNPVMLLLNDLLEARKRGVSVTMYLNTRFRDTDKSERSFIMSPVFKELKGSGCDIYLIPSRRGDYPVKDFILQLFLYFRFLSYNFQPYVPVNTTTHSHLRKSPGSIFLYSKVV